MRIGRIRGDAMLAAAVITATVLCWGSSARAAQDERRRRLQGDDLVVDPMWQHTRAVTIAVRPDEVWPWLVQVGHLTRRAGWYTPYWFDRVMWGIRERGADVVISELQAPRGGDGITDSRDGSAYFTVETVDPHRALVLFSTTHLRPV
jgi:hypothetical protein